MTGRVKEALAATRVGHFSYDKEGEPKTAEHR